MGLSRLCHSPDSSSRKYVYLPFSSSESFNIFYHLYSAVKHLMPQIRSPTSLSLLSVLNQQAREWKQSQHPRHFQAAGNHQRAPVSAQVTIGSGITAPNLTGGWCSEAHRRRRSVSRLHGGPTLCTVEHSAPLNTPQRAREPTPTVQLRVALCTLYSQNICFDTRP